MKIGRSPKFLFAFALLLLGLVGGFFLVLQRQISADTTANCLVTNEKSEIIDNPPVGKVQNCGAMQVNIGGFSDCSVSDVGISGSSTGITVRVESASLGVVRTYLPKYCQVNHLMALPVDTTKSTSTYTYTVTAPGYETLIGTVVLRRTNYGAPGSKYDGYVYYTGGINAIYRQKQHSQGSLRVFAMQYSNLPVKVTGPNGYNFETVTYESAGDIEGLAPGMYTVEISQRPTFGIGHQLSIPESARKQEVLVETGKVTFVLFSEQDGSELPVSLSGSNDTTAEVSLQQTPSVGSSSKVSSAVPSSRPSSLTSTVSPSASVTRAPSSGTTQRNTSSQSSSSPVANKEGTSGTLNNTSSSLGTEEPGSLSEGRNDPSSTQNTSSDTQFTPNSTESRKGLIQRLVDWVKNLFR